MHNRLIHANDIRDSNRRDYNISMIWQTFIVTIAIVAAAAYLVRCIVLASRSSAAGGCGGGCHCSDAANRASDRLGRKRELVQLGARGSVEQESDGSDDALR
jgi:hypothetical protein